MPLRCHECRGKFGLVRRTHLTFSGYLHFLPAFLHQEVPQRPQGANSQGAGETTLPPMASLPLACAVPHGDPGGRDQGLALLEAFDSIDLMAIQDTSAVDAAVKRVGRVQAMADGIRAELNCRLPRKANARKAADH